MKKNLFFRFLFISLFIHCVGISLSAQGENRNLFQLKFNVNYFKEKPRTIYWHTLIDFPDISYKRFFKSKPYFFEFEFDYINIRYIYSPTRSDIGKPIIRNHLLFEGKFGSYLDVTSRLSFFVKSGLVYRYGLEHRITSVRQIGGANFFTEITVARHLYNDFGVGASIELLYKVGNRWYLSIDAGGERFFIRKITTKGQLRAGIGIGYAF